MSLAGHTPPRRLGRLLMIALTTVGAVVAGPVATPATATPTTATPTTSAPTTSAAPARDAVRVQVLSVNPSTPTPSMTKQPLTLQLQLTNTTDANLGTVTVHAVRGTPIERARTLNAAIAHPGPPDPSLASPVPPDGKPVTAKLGPRAQAAVTYRTSSDIPQDAGLCLCHKAAIYPIYVTVTAGPRGSGQTDAGQTQVGHTQTYLPAFDVTPKPVRVSWIWPLLDRPHRLTSDTTFLDDDLAASIEGGRLDRMLQVAEDVGADVPMTLVVDPELIDELAVMSGGYQVRSGTGTVPGVGQAAAQQWLARLRTVLAMPGMELAFTAPSDPDVVSLVRSDLTWASALGHAAQQRVQAALGGHTASDELALPYRGRLGAQALDALAAQGVRTVIVNDKSLPGGVRDGLAPDALAPLTSPSGGMHAVVTSSAIQRYVAPVLSGDGAGLAALPQLVSQVAIHAVTDPDRSGYLAIAAPRYLDPDPAVAARAIRDTAATFWATPVPVRAAVGSVRPVNHGHLVATKPPATRPAALVLAMAHALAGQLPVLTSLLSQDPAALSQLATLPGAIQRLESAGWLDRPIGATVGAATLLPVFIGMSDGVHLVRPSGGSYTLASSNAPLPITVANNLGYTVRVQVSVNTVNGLPGLTARTKTETIAPHTRETVKVPVTVQRTGRIQVVAQLSTVGNSELGDPLYLSVRSTALGTVGVVITIVAGVVLGLALLIRFTLLLVRRRRRAAADSVA